ncbi:hypothetical protein N3K66_007918 [Trichothecium roseum]|uniref:Uncharacterized protein n=1 Tax=Trichothecium roseum TaxID=47278 RepID=A0ACC0UTA6_9HYPO|nr:hypothetical protein N3K66_007918 [Trichothecium roseum]
MLHAVEAAIMDYWSHSEEAVSSLASGDEHAAEEIQTCHICGKPGTKLFTCIQCNNLSFHDSCWSKWILHEDGAVGFDRRPHEKADLEVIGRLRRTLDASTTDEEKNQELRDDEETTWFGVAQGEAHRQVFQDYGRFAFLMNESLEQMEPSPRTGKSTLIKILIERLEKRYKGEFPTPIASLPQKNHVTTTGNVHLYAEPATFYTQTPRLYADCEGLEGGEALPMGLRHLNLPRSDRLGNNMPPQARHRLPNEAKRKLKRTCHRSQRLVLWTQQHDIKKKREFLVTNLYPRLLYTFSDTVVFVLRNPRTFESTVLTKLLDWGEACIDKSLNQPTLPHAIITLNATDDVDDDQLGIAAFDHFTKNLDKPFDFFKESLKHNNIRRDFGGSILKLAFMVKEHSSHPTLRTNAREIFMLIAPMVASCITLAAARQNLFGLPERLFDEHFVTFCENALQEFSDLYWPCSFKHKRGPCRNMRSGHSDKGHQNSSGKTIAQG